MNWLNIAAVSGQVLPTRTAIPSQPGRTLPARSALFPKWRDPGFKRWLPFYGEYIFFDNFHRDCFSFRESIYCDNYFLSRWTGRLRWKIIMLLYSVPSLIYFSRSWFRGTVLNIYLDNDRQKEWNRAPFGRVFKIIWRHPKSSFKHARCLLL